MTELRRVPAADAPQFDGFAVGGDTVVWAESIAPDGARRPDHPVADQLAHRRSAVEPHRTPGEPTFYGGQYDVVVHDGTVFWAAIGVRWRRTEVRSVSLGGGTVTTQELTGDVRADRRGPGRSASTVAAASRCGWSTTTPTARSAVATTAQETATCSPVWCRIGVLGAECVGPARHREADGSQPPAHRRQRGHADHRDVALLDRYVPLKTDRGQNSELRGVGLSLYDITTGRTDLVATDVGNVRGQRARWCGGRPTAGDALTWHAIDLRTARLSRARTAGSRERVRRSTSPVADLIAALAHLGGFMVSRWYALVVDAADPARLSRWWAEVLGYRVLDEDDNDVIVGPARNLLPDPVLQPEHRAEAREEPAAHRPDPG